MNKIRIIGLLIVVTGLILQNYVISFISALIIGIGIGLLFRGKFGETKT